MAKVNRSFNPYPNRGGFRPGAGRPVGTGRYGLPTSPIRVPTILVKEVEKFVEMLLRNKYDLSNPDDVKRIKEEVK